MGTGVDGMAMRAVVEHVVCLEITHGLLGQLLLSAAAAVSFSPLPVRCGLATMRFDRVRARRRRRLCKARHCYAMACT